MGGKADVTQNIRQTTPSRTFSQLFLVVKAFVDILGKKIVWGHFPGSPPK